MARFVSLAETVKLPISSPSIAQRVTEKVFRASVVGFRGSVHVGVLSMSRSQAVTSTVIFAFFALKCADVKLELNEKVKLPSESILATPESKAKKESASGSSAGTLASAAKPTDGKTLHHNDAQNNTQNFFKDIHNLPLSHVFPSITESEIIPSATS